MISNSATGNSQAGFHVVAGQGDTGQTAVFQNNTSVGNAGPGAHCGVLNLGQLVGYFDAVPNPPMVAPLNANGNFWGTTHGPAPTGASDAFGGACDQHGGKTTVTSYASAGFAITTH